MTKVIFLSSLLFFVGCSQIFRTASGIPSSKPRTFTALSHLSTQTLCAGGEVFFGMFRGTHPSVHTGDSQGTIQSDMLCHFPSTGLLSLYFIDKDGNLPSIPSWSTNFCQGAPNALHVGDFNGDGRDDVLCQNGGTYSIAYSHADGTLDVSHPWSANLGFCIGQNQRLFVGDMNGDGYSDLFCHSDDGGAAILYGFSLSAPDITGNQYRNVQFGWNSPEYPNAEWDNGALSFCVGTYGQIVLADVNGDGRYDAVCHDKGGGALWVLYSDNQGHISWGSGWSNTKLNFCAGASVYAADINGDGREDLLCSAQGNMWILYSTGSGVYSWTAEWDNLNAGFKFCGAQGDELLSGFFDRNVRADLACFHSATGGVDFLFADLNGHFSLTNPGPAYNQGNSYACSSAPGISPSSNAGTDDSKYNVADSYSIFVSKLYPALLGRTSNRTESYGLITQLRQGNALQNVAYEIGNSTEGRCYLLKFFSQQYSLPDLSGDFVFYSMCHSVNGYSWPQDWKTVVYQIVTSGEFLQQGGSSTDLYAETLYSKLLGRSWTAGEGKWWTGMSIPAIASAMVNTPETSYHLTTILYEAFLHRGPGSNEFVFWEPTLQSPGMNYTLLLSQFLSSYEFRVGARPSICGTLIDVSGATGVGAILNNCIQQTIASCQATGTSPCTLDLPQGVYLIDQPLVIPGSITLRTQGLWQEFPSTGCLSHSDIQNSGQQCATLFAAPTLAGNMLSAQNVSQVKFDHIVLNGNHFDRMRNGILSQNPQGMNANIVFCNHCSFNFGGSVNALNGSGMQLYGDSALVASSVFRDNGQGYLWQQGKNDADTSVSDGLTLSHSTGGCVIGNQFINNTDMDFISGGGSNSEYLYNTIYHSSDSWMYSNGGMMLDNFDGNTDGDFTNSLIAYNRVLCSASNYTGEPLCKVGLRVGARSYYTYRHGPESYTSYHNHRVPNILGGVIFGNYIAGAGHGILVSGAGDALNPTSIFANTVVGSLPQQYFPYWGGTINVPNIAPKFQKNCEAMATSIFHDTVGRPSFLIPTNAYSISPDSFVDTHGEANFVSRAWQSCY